MGLSSEPSQRATANSKSCQFISEGPEDFVDGGWAGVCPSHWESLLRRYYFDTRDNDLFIKDEDGFELPSADVAKRKASVSLVEMVRDLVPGSVARRLVVEVRDEWGPVFRASLR